MSRTPSRSPAEPDASAASIRRPPRLAVKRLHAVAIFALSIALAGCLGDGGGTAETSGPSPPTDETVPEGPSQVHVSLEDFQFVEQSVTIRVNDTITWTHHDGPFVPHTVTTDTDAPEAFDSSPLCTGMDVVGVPGICMTDGDTYSHTFRTEGTYPIYCKPHSSGWGQGMSMTVTVLADDPELPAVTV